MNDYIRFPKSDWLEHHGIMGQKWGVKHGPPYPIESAFKNPKDLVESTSKFKYKNFDYLMSPDEVRKQKAGSCHDMVMWEMEELSRMGYSPKGLFMMEYSNNQGGMTHSLVYYEKDGKTHWVEPRNTWPERSGDIEYASVNALKSHIREMHKSGEFGSYGQFKNIIFGKVKPSDHVIGEDLQTFVDRCLR